MGKMREVRAFPLRLPWSTGSLGMTHFCAVLFLNNSNQCEEPEEEEGGSEQPCPTILVHSFPFQRGEAWPSLGVAAAARSLW